MVVIILTAMVVTMIIGFVVYTNISNKHCTTASDCNSKRCKNCDCTIDGKCLCGGGWSGSHCEVPFCTKRSTCSNHGFCMTTSHSIACKCDPGFVGLNCEIAIGCPIDCTRHGGNPNAMCTQCENCKGAWTGAHYMGAPFAAPSSTQDAVVPIYSYYCDTDHVFATISRANDILYSNKILPMYQQLVAGSLSSQVVAEVDYSGHLRVFNAVPSRSSIVWDSGPPLPSNSTSFSLKLRDDGRLVVLGSTGDIVWSSSDESLPRGNYFVQLGDYGTLSLYRGHPDAIGELVWQSQVYDAPSPCIRDNARPAFYGVSKDSAGAIPVYEFFDPTTNDHTYRTSPAPIEGYYPKSKPPVRFYALTPQANSYETEIIYSSLLCLDGWCDTNLSPDIAAHKSCNYWDSSVPLAALLPELQKYVNVSQQRLDKLTASTKAICPRKDSACVGWGVDATSGAFAVSATSTNLILALLEFRCRGKIKHLSCRLIRVDHRMHNPCLL